MSDFGFDPRMFSGVPLLGELAKVLSWTGGPINYDIAGDTARSIAVPEGQLPVATADRDAEAFAQAVEVAELWLDQVTDVPAVKGPADALTPLDWVRTAAGPAGLGGYIEPLASAANAAVTGGQLPEEMQAMAAQLGPGMAAQLGQVAGAFGAMAYGFQLGTVAGHMAGQLLGLYDLGLPTIEPGRVGTVGRTAEQFAADYEFEPTEFRYWLALREAAFRRLWAGVPWLHPHLVGLLGRFAAESDASAGSMLSNLGGMGFDPMNPGAMEAALTDPDAFTVELTTAQRHILEQMQAVVALVEGWNETLVRAAAGEKLPALPRIQEAMRRRRAEKGPGEQFLQQLLGLDLTPADLRVGVSFCEAVVAARGQEVLDRIWQNEKLLPHPGELAEPSRWLVRYAAAEIEAQLEADLGPFEDPHA